MLWSELKERARQMIPAGRQGTPLISEALSLWVEEAQELRDPLAAKDLDRDALASELLGLNYEIQTDRAVHEAVRAIPAPVTVDAVVSTLLERFCTHPAAQALTNAFGCKAAELVILLNLKANASPVVVGNGTEMPMLKSLTTDLTEIAMTGEYSALVPGPATDAIERALLKSRRGSVVVTGLQGSGKTVAVQALAHRIVNNQTHPKLRNVKILELSVGALVAGTQFRGQFSDKVEGILKELKTAKGKIILFIDELHTVLGCGRVHGDSYDFANALKTALSSNYVRLIGATTDGEYSRYVLKDPAFARRLERVRLQPIEDDFLVSVLKSQVNVLAEHHRVCISESAWREALCLSNLYLVNRSAQPDRVLDLLDSACTLVTKSPGNLERSHILSALAQTTGIPADLLEKGLASRLDSARDVVKREVFGQDQIVEAIIARLQSNPLHRRASERPIGSFLLTGPTGVGKSLIAEVIGKTVFGSREAFLRIHCGEFAEGGIAKLIGVPLPGLDAQDANGVLCNFLREHPCGIVLFDEIEKAHSTLYELLLGILDKGEFQSGDGLPWSLRNHLVFCTSNALTAKDLRGAGMGFGAQTGSFRSREHLVEKLPLFRKELLNRFDELLVANPLSSESRLAILKHHIAVACAAARAAGVPEPSEAALVALLNQNESAIDLAGGRAIERLALDKVIVPMQQAIRAKPACANRQASVVKEEVKQTRVVNKETVKVL